MFRSFRKRPLPAFKTARKLLVYLIVLSLVITMIPFEVYGIEYQATNLVLDYGKIDGAGTRISAAGGSIAIAVGDSFYIALDSSQINDNLKITIDRIVSGGSTKYDGVKSASLISDVGNSVYDGHFHPTFASYQSSNFFGSFIAEFQPADIADIKSIGGMVYLFFSSDAVTTFLSAQAFTNVAAVTTYTISGNAGIAGATLSYTDGTAKTATSDSSGNYSFTVSSGWTGTVTPSKSNYTFAPASMNYSNVTGNQSAQNYSAVAAYIYDFEANTGGSGTDTVTQSVNGEAVSCTVTGDFWQIFTENDSIGADLETFSGNTLMTDNSYEDSGATSIRIATVGNKLFTLKSLNLFDNYFILHSGSNITITSSKGGTPVELTGFTSYSDDSGYMSIDLSANPSFKDVTYVDFTVSSGKMLLVLDNIVLSDIKEGEVWNEITNRTQLENINNNLSANYRLMADIDLSGANWVPLGSATTPFTGKFDGNSKSIRNLTITDTTKTEQGLFSVIGSSGSVSKLGIQGANITTANNTGILAGTNAGTISQCYTKGSVGGYSYVGGLVGQNSGTIQNSYTQASVSGKDFFGGLAGSNSGTVLTSYASSPLGASVFNNYLSFNGTPVGNYSAPNSGGYINIAHKDYYVQNKFTLEAWFQWDNVGTDNCNFIIGKGYEQFEIHTGGGAGVNGLRFIPIWNNGGDSWIDVKNVIQPGWFHVAAVYDYSASLQQATCRVFINGVAQDLWRGTTNLGKAATINRTTNTLGYGMVSGSLVPQQNNINIGRRTDGWYYFDGKISDVRFWNIARTETEIKRDKDKVLTGTEPGLVGYWKLNEASGNALDSTPNGNNGTLVGDVVRTSELAAVHKGGLIGYNTGTVSSSFYDSEVANLNDDGAGIHKSTAEMKNIDTYTGAGWNFTDLWDINSAYPYFKNQTFNVYFESNGGGAVSPIYGKSYLETITQPGNPSKTDYIFGGWYKEPSLTNPWDFASDTMPARDITLYARWLGNQCTVTYDAEGGSVTPGSQIKMVGATYGKGNDGVTEDYMPIPTKEGYTFNGWYSGDNGTGNYIPNSTVVTSTANHTLYAKWSVQQCTLTFDTEGGNAIAPIIQNYSTQVVAPADPSKEGHAFAGWYEGDDGTGSEVSFPIALTTNKTIYAKWTVNPYTVTFKDYNDATLKTETVLYGAGATAPANPVRTGYTFTGWSAAYTNITGNLTVTAQYAANTNTAYKVEHYKQNVNGVGYTLADTDNLTGTTDQSATALAKSYTGFAENTGYAGRIAAGTIAGNGSLVLKLYYDWIPYTVTFRDYNDAILKTETVLYGANATAPAEPAHAGYTFAGWSTVYTNITGNLTVTAQYTANTNTAYKVLHYQQKVDKSGYAVFETEDLTGTTDATATAAAKTYTGFTENTGYSDRVASGTIAANGSLVLKLYYDRIPYTVTFKDYNDATLKTETVVYGADATAPAVPVRTGYTFTDWSAAFAGIIGNLTVTAKYAANTNTAYKVEHYQQNVNGTGYTLADTDDQTGTTDLIVAAVPKDYTGFVENTSHMGRILSGTIAGNGSLVLKLYYDRIPYTVTFKDYNDSTLKTETILFGANATAPANPTRIGYTFTDWSAAYTNIAGDLTVIAQYTANTNTAYKVEHYKQNVNGVGYTLTDTDNLTGTTDATATAAARTYTGFAENTSYAGRVPSGTIAGNGSLVLKLYYDRIPYTVTFKDYNNTIVDTQTVLFGANATAPANPTRIGYTFTDWSAAYTNIAEDLTVTAQYTANTNTAYKVEHYKQNVNGVGYTLTDTDNLTGTTDATATAAARTYTGFAENTSYAGRVPSGTIAGNGSLVLKLYYDRIPYTVTFKDYNNTIVDTQTVLFGANATAPANPTRIGYTFTDWSAAYSNIDEDLTVTAQYTANTNTAYKVEHYKQNVNGVGYTLVDTDNLAGTTDQSATAAARTYTGFAENTSYAGRAPSGTIAGNGSLVLKLYYNRIPYTVTFKDYNDTTLKTETVLFGANATEPAEPTRTGYTFTGWSAAITGITGNLTVTAQYTANTNTAYKVEHYQQKVDKSGYAVFETEDLTGTTDTGKTAIAQSYTGFTENTSYADRVPSGTIEGNGNLVLKLYYDRNQYTVAFKDYNDATLKTETVVYGGSATAPAEPARTGYTFTGWSAAITGITGNLTVTAQYTANTNTAYKVEHYQQKVDKSGYEVFEADNLTGTTDTTATAAAKTYTGFSENTGYESRVSSGNITGNGSLVLKLYYDRIPYTVTFEDYDSTVIDTQTVLYRANATAPTQPERTGYTFTGWSSAVTDITDDLTVTAQYTANTNTAYKVEHYQQKVDKSGYEVFEADNLTGTTDTTATAAAKTYTGFSENTGYESRVSSGNITGNGSLVLKLYYDRIPYTVTFEDYDSTVIDTQTVLYRANATAPTQPERAGYTFTSWSTAYTNITGDLTVIAQYAANANTAYKVEHYQQNVNGVGYTLADIDNLTGTTDTTATAESKSYFDFSENISHPDRVVSGVISGDGSRVLKLYYDRVALKPVDNQEMQARTVGYTAGTQETKTITLAKNGSGTITDLLVSVSGGTSSRFIISQPTITVLDASHPSTTFTIRAKDDLSVGTYTETVKVSAANVSEMTFTVTQTINSVPTSKPEAVIVIVNGVKHEAASSETKKVNDQTITTVTVDDNKIKEKLQNEGEGSTVIIPVNNKADVVVGELNGQTVKNMEQKDAVLEIKTEDVTYTLPASQINIDDVSARIGKDKSLVDIKVSVIVATPPQDTVKVVENTANRNNYQVVVKPVEFSITCTSGEKTVEVSKFNGYVERTVAIPKGIDPSKITTGIVLNKDGTFSHVPTTIVVIDGKYYAKINSLTNSTYSVIWSPKTFEDVQNHWAKEAVNDMGSRLIIDGVGENKFEPDRGITRAEFAVIVVKALGLMRPGTGKDTFSDVVKGSYYYDAVSIAYDYGIVSGFGNGEFKPMEKITREEAMSMAAKALKLTGLKVELKPDEMNDVLAGFGDSVRADDWAKASMAQCVKAGIISGKSGKTLAPKDQITRAEVAVIIRNLLQKSGLI